MKKVLSLVLVLAMVLGSFSFVSAASYTDVTGTEFTAAVDRLSTLGILEGYPDGTFKPTESITRAEFAAVAVRAKGLKNVALAAQGLPTGFTDVPATHWASGYVGTAARLGIVNGIGWGQFAPASPVKYEEAVTMIVRALGYEAAAQAKGGYPYGYLIVASEIKLLDGVKGTQGVSATRGLVAQLTDNALEIAMMVQVGFGSEVKWVVSGSKEHGDDAIYLLDAMGFDSVEGRVVAVNTTTNKITVDPTDEDLKNVTLKVAKGFDFYAVEGLETKFWSKDDMVEVYVVNEEAKFDAVKVDGDEVVLIVEDENYEVARGAVLTIDGEKVAQKDFVADYAKIVLNDDNEIIWAQGYNLDGFILVEEVKSEVAYSYDGYDEIDLEDFTVVKEGKTIAIDAIEEEDVLFFNVDEEFAIVYNKGTEGELDRVYADGTFRFEGKAYSDSSIATAIYFDAGKIGDLDAAILDDFLDDEATITVFVDFAGNVVVVVGEVSSVGNSAYGVLLSAAQEYTGRKGAMVALDLRNGANVKVSYDIEVADLEDLGNFEISDLAKGVVIKVTVDKDGDVTAIELPEELLDADKFETDDANVKVDGVSYKLQTSTIVFYDSNKQATTLGNVKDEFTEVKAGAAIYIEKGRVVAVVGETDTDADTKDVTGLVTGVKALTNNQLQFTVKVFGVTQRLVTESKGLDVEDYDNYVNTIRTFKVGETSGEIKSFGTVGHRTLTVNSISGRTITPNPTTDKAVELNSNAVIYDNALEPINLRDLKSNDSITVYFQGTSLRFVDYVIVNKTLSADQIAANDVDELILDLPAVTALVAGDSVEVAAARSAYVALTTAQKALVEELDVLEAAEAKILELNPDTAKLAAINAANTNIKMITALEAAIDYSDAKYAPNKLAVAELMVAERPFADLEEVQAAFDIAVGLMPTL